jgi:excisionase family DNA binding protein
MIDATWKENHTQLNEITERVTITTEQNDRDVMTANELAVKLLVHPVTIRLQAAAGRIPGKRIGNRWRFSRKRIERWLEEEDKAA